MDINNKPPPSEPIAAGARPLATSPPGPELLPPILVCMRVYVWKERNEKEGKRKGKRNKGKEKKPVKCWGL